MGTQTMGSHSDQQQQQQHSQFLPLSRQASLYSLTLDEVHNQLGGLGKPLGSMNLDELLKNVCTGDENDNAAAATSALQHRPSLRHKTVDEVWRDIQQGRDKSNNQDKVVQERQPTLGEMTLEDFLFKAGIVSQDSAEDKGIGTDLNISTPQAQWLQYQLPSLQQQQQPPQHPQQNIIGGFVPMQPLPVVPNTILENNYPAISSPLMCTLSDTQTPGRKRGHSGDMIERTVERRQKRMIKNRESAARSRARKQAYTNELENKVSRLEEENARLKREKETEQVLPYTPPPPEPKFQLRRTSSAGF